MRNHRDVAATLSFAFLLASGCSRYPAPIKTLRFLGECCGHVVGGVSLGSGESEREREARESPESRMWKDSQKRWQETQEEAKKVRDERAENNRQWLEKNS